MGGSQTDFTKVCSIEQGLNEGVRRHARRQIPLTKLFQVEELPVGSCEDTVCFRLEVLGYRADFDLGLWHGRRKITS